MDLVIGEGGAGADKPGLLYPSEMNTAVGEDGHYRGDRESSGMGREVKTRKLPINFQRRKNTDDRARTQIARVDSKRKGGRIKKRKTSKHKRSKRNHKKRKTHKRKQHKR